MFNINAITDIDALMWAVALCIYAALEQIVSDLFAAGSDTVTNSLKWLIQYMVENPDKMKKCQEEIDRVVPAGSSVALEHRSQLVKWMINTLPA